LGKVVLDHLYHQSATMGKVLLYILICIIIILSLGLPWSQCLILTAKEIYLLKITKIT